MDIQFEHLDEMAFLHNTSMRIYVECIDVPDQIRL